jgi:DNA-3-methyladenine glycosylase I
MYSHMQAVGLVNDHIMGCYRYREIKKMGRDLSLEPKG